MRVMVAVDDSEFSAAAIRTVISQLRPDAAEILVVCIVDARLVATPPQWSQPTSPFADAQGVVARAAEVLQGAGFSSSTRVIEGDVRSGILDIAVEWQAELIILGSHGRTGLRRFTLGSVAETVSRHARCSVMIVRTSPVA